MDFSENGFHASSSQALDSSKQVILHSPQFVHLLHTVSKANENSSIESSITRTKSSPQVEASHPEGGGGYDFTMADTEKSHMILTSTQLVECLRDPKRASAYNVLLSSLPKKVDGPLSKAWAAPGYGIQEVRSWSLFRIIRLVIIFNSPGFLFLGLWLGLKDMNDLQTAFVLVSYINTMLSILVALPQYLAQ